MSTGLALARARLALYGTWLDRLSPIVIPAGLDPVRSAAAADLLRAIVEEELARAGAELARQQIRGAIERDEARRAGRDAQP